MRSFAPRLSVLLLVCLAPANGWALHTTIGGRAVDLDGSAEIREVIESNANTGHDRTQQTLRLRAAAELTSWLRFDSTTVGTNGGPTFQASKSGTFNLHDTFQDVSPAIEFEEAFFEAHLDRFEIRGGKQKFAWGKLDRTQPNDLLNPERYVDPLLQEENDRKIGIPSIEATYSLPAAAWLPDDARFTAVWVPFYVPYRFPNPGERWFPPAATPPTAFSVPAGLFTFPNGSPSPPFTVPVGLSTENTPTPAFTFANTEWAARWSGSIQGSDVALYYFHGFDVSPAFSLHALAFGEPDDNPRNPLGVKNLSAATVLAPVFRNIDSWGADWAYTWDAFTFRAEGAYVSGRPFSRDLRFLVTDPRSIADQIRDGLGALRAGAGRVPIDLGTSFVVHDAAEWGVGADYSVNGYFLLLQVNQTDVLHNDVDLLIKDVDTRLLANLRKAWLNDDLQAQLIGVYAIESDYTVLMPRLTYRFTDSIDARVGYLFIAGRAQSIGGQYKKNDEAFVRLRYSF
ncbi:MAG TPA: hypothetical protein VMW17_02550 [Candidatus Binatia bacterium]|nr:hypothetical protein [Candidatus Binatia bacterium]